MGRTLVIALLATPGRSEKDVLRLAAAVEVGSA